MIKVKRKEFLHQRGITLVALVISIILLLILAGISISALTNQGLFGRANEAKRESEIASIKEQIALDIYEKQLEPPVGSITEEQLETILGKYGTVNKEDGTIVGITTEKGYEILLKDIYGGETVAESVPESVPDGAVVTPINDITTWLKTAGISKQYSYTTIEQVIADTTCTESLMNNENAMKYLERSTEFANAICASETAMTYLGQTAYVDDTVLNSDDWVAIIMESSYKGLVIKKQNLMLNQWTIIPSGQTDTYEFTDTSKYINIAVSSESTLYAMSDYVDFSKYSVLNYTFEGYGKGNWTLYSPRVYITDELENDTEIYVGSSDGNTSLAEHTYDVSNLSGKYAIKISCHAHPYWGNAQGWARLTTAVLL